jgi:hypothetical protein
MNGTLKATKSKALVAGFRIHSLIDAIFLMTLFDPK